MQSNIAVLSDTNEFSLFKAIKADVFIAETTESAIKTLRALTIKYSLIFVAETLTKQIGEQIKKYEDLVYPMIITLPTAKGSENFGIQTIIEKAKECLGINIFKE